MLDRRAFTKLLVAAAASLSLSCGSRRRYTSMLPHLFCCTIEEMAMIVSSALPNAPSAVELSRNADGARIYVRLEGIGVHELLAFSKAENPRLLNPQGRSGITNEGSFTAWGEGDGLRFRSGEF